MTQDNASRAARIQALRAELESLVAEEAIATIHDLDAIRARCATLANDGRLVDAVKLYRNRTGIPLVDSLRAVASMIRPRRCAF